MSDWDKHLFAFIEESDRIEGIFGKAEAQVPTYEEFLHLPEITVESLERFVSRIQPGAILRDRVGLDVRVGFRVPPGGGPHIRRDLQYLLSGLDEGSDPFEVHCRYETLHPFTDGNGRSGWAMWAWMMATRGDDLRLGFLHAFYYQTLEHHR